MKKVMITAMLAMMTVGAMAQTAAPDTTKTVDARMLTGQGDRLPKFKSGMPAVMQYVGNHLKYPKEAMQNGVEGRVVMNFLVHADGTVSDARPIDAAIKFFDIKKMSEKTGKSEQSLKAHYTKLFADEAARVINAMPKWKPAMQQGQAVNVYCSMPVTFAIPRFGNTHIGQ